MGAFRGEAARAEGPYFGEQGLTEVELSLGPALRVHRLEPTASDADSGTIVEGVAHQYAHKAVRHDPWIQGSVNSGFLVLSVVC